MPEVPDVSTVGEPMPAELISTLDGLRRPVVVGHVRPDADCLGSMFAMALRWPGEGGPARVSLPEGSLSRRLVFLAEWANVPVATVSDFSEADGIIAVDTAKQPRCNVAKELGDDWAAGRPIVNIDHHTSNTRFGTVNWVDAQAGSAAELVYRLLRTARRPIDETVASFLYAGIHSDTVGFSLPTTRSSALHAAADLVDCGARVAAIGEHLCRSQSRPEFNLNRVIYDNSCIVADGRVAYSTASYDEIVGAGCTFADIDDQIAIPRSLAGIRIAVLFTEGRRGKTRLNLRGEAGVEVLGLATALGGGGHATAAGAIVDGDVDEAVARVIPLAIEYLNEHYGS